MKAAYEASNAVEAHMIRDLLMQEGLSAEIHGEHLLGAMGDLPVAGLVRVMVDESDFAQARAVVERWDTAQPKESPRPTAPSSRRWRWLFIGLAIGVGATCAYFRSPVTVDGIDHNRDGLLDEKYTYAPSGTLLKVEIDRNLDRKVDYIAHYDRRGIIEASESDDNFDGVFETHSTYRDGSVSYSAVDTDGDGYADLGIQYTDGVLASMEYLNPSTGLPLRVEHYKLNKLVDAEVDSDRDGKIDTRYVYDGLGQIVSTEKIAK
jgi:hypothetical protein